MLSAPWHLFAPAGDGAAEVILALYRWRGVELTAHTAPPGCGFALAPPDRDQASLTRPQEALAALPGGFEPGEITLLLTTLKALERLEALIPSQFPADLDLKVFALRQELAALETGLRTGPRPEEGSALDLGLGPLLWRLILVDEQPGLFLLSGFSELTALARAQLRRPAALRHDSATQRRLYRLWLQENLGAAAHATDWNRALGPGGREKTILPVVTNTEISSIGSGRGFR